MLQTLKDIAKSSAKSAVPAALIDQVRKYRRRELMDAYAKAEIIFFHIPRTAGTSVSHALYGRQINHFSVREMMPLLPKTILDLPRFAIIRNPWDRAVSAWTFARNGGGGDGLVKVRSAFRYDAPQFRTFEHFVHEWLEPSNRRQLDGMFQPQTNFLLDSRGQIPLDHLGRFEDLAATEAWLRGQNPKLREIPHLNAVERVPYRVHYSPASRSAIARIYARDIELFGYDF